MKIRRFFENSHLLNYEDKMGDIIDIFKDYELDYDSDVDIKPLYSPFYSDDRGEITIEIGLNGKNKLVGLKKCLDRLKASMDIYSIRCDQHPIGEYPASFKWPYTQTKDSKPTTYISYLDLIIKNSNELRVSKIAIFFKII